VFLQNCERAASGISPGTKNFFAKKRLSHKGYPLMGRTIFEQVFVREGMSNFQNSRVPPAGGRICRTHIQARLRCAGPRQLISPEVTEPVG